MEGIKMLKDFSAASRMAFGSLLMVLFLTSGCASKNNTYYGDISTNPGTTGVPSLIGVIAAHIKTNAYSVPKADRDKHEQCVYFTLENLFLGERCDWYSSNGATKGQVQVVSYQPAGSGYCATLFSGVYHKGNWANWQDVACTNGTGNQWKFMPQ